VSEIGALRYRGLLAWMGQPPSAPRHRVLQGPRVFTDYDRALLERVFRKLGRLEAKMGLLDDIKAAEDAEGVAIQNVLTFLGTLTAQVADLKAQLEAAGQDPAKAQALIDEITQHTAALAAAVPAAPEPTPAP